MTTLHHQFSVQHLVGLGDNSWVISLVLSLSTRQKYRQIELPAIAVVEFALNTRTSVSLELGGPSSLTRKNSAGYASRLTIWVSHG